MGVLVQRVLRKFVGGPSMLVKLMLSCYFRGCPERLGARLALTLPQFLEALPEQFEQADGHWRQIGWRRWEPSFGYTDRGT